MVKFYWIGRPLTLEERVRVLEQKENNLSGQSLDDEVLSAFAAVPAELKVNALRLVEALLAEQSPCASPRQNDQQ